MLRPSPIWIALLSFGTIAPAARAADPPCPSSVSPDTLPAPGAKPTQTEKAAEHRPEGQIDLSSDTAIMGVNGSGILKGNVQVRQGDREIRADQIQYDKSSNSIKTDGAIDYRDPVVHVTGNGGDYSPSHGGDFRAAQFEMLQRAARGSAQTMSLTPEGIIRLQDVTFTTCPATDSSWHLSAQSITLDTRTKIGSGRDAYVDFKGVPILYLPWVSFPLGSERKSGFLFPTVGNTTSSGAEVSVPYYWNIAPNLDFTFQPVLYSRRGADVGGDFRYLTQSSRGELNWNYLPYDNVFGDSRSNVRLRNVSELGGGLRFTVDAQNVSDTQYFENFATGPEGTSTAFVERRATLSYRDVHWRVDGEAQQYQTIDSTLNPIDRPYARVPRIAVNADYGWGPQQLLHYGFDSEIVNFDRAIGVTGWRIDLMPTASLNLNGPGYFVRPEVSYRATQYELNNVPPGQSRSPSRDLPVTSFDAGLLFDREIAGRYPRKLTLEPRFLYLYVPYRNQNELPVFDTALPDLNPVELFRTNRYVGADRVSDANQLAVGVTSRLLDGRDGRQFLTMTLGQAYYFQTPRVRLPDEAPLTGKRSDFVAQLGVSAFQHWSANLGLQWNPQSSQTERADVNVQYKPGPEEVINLAYRFERSTVHPTNQCSQQLLPPGTAAPPGFLAPVTTCGYEQIELSAAWPIAGRWNAFAKGVYSIQDNQALERFVGFEYRACCWKVRFGARRYVSTHPVPPATTGAQDTGVWLQLELTGLASVGSASDSFLTEAIRGYVPAEAYSQKLKAP